MYLNLDCFHADDLAAVTEGRYTQFTILVTSCSAEYLCSTAISLLTVQASLYMHVTLYKHTQVVAVVVACSQHLEVPRKNKSVRSHLYI